MENLYNGMIQNDSIKNFLISILDIIFIKLKIDKLIGSVKLYKTVKLTK